MSLNANHPKRELERKLQLKLLQHGDLPSCLSCEQFDKMSETCKRYDKRPPLEWLLVGCNDWDQAIPF